MDPAFENDVATISAILTDFDGVIRHWNSASELGEVESALGLPNGAILGAVFEEPAVTAAITGEISHEQWIELVDESLRTRFGALAATRATTAWSGTTFVIDAAVMGLFGCRAPSVKLVLVTNATSRLAGDLRLSGLEYAFDDVVNSSELGIAKPSPALFETVLRRFDLTAGECVFIDDRPENVLAARALGIESYLFEDIDGLTRFLDRYSWREVGA